MFIFIEIPINPIANNLPIQLIYNPQLPVQIAKIPLCTHPPQPYKQAHPFTHQLPPQVKPPKLASSPTNPSNGSKIHEVVAKKNQEIRQLIEKNNELVDIIGQKEHEKQKINRKYNELVDLYEEIKDRREGMGLELQVKSLQGENQVLMEKVRRLERELIESEREIIRKVKFYEDKNQDSRKLLEKLNENLTKRQEKFKVQLQECQSELRKKHQAYQKLQQQYKYLQSLNSEKQDQLTKILQQTERDRSAFSQNISMTELKLQAQNNKLSDEVNNLNSVIEALRMEMGGKLGGLRDESEGLRRENQGLRREIQGLKRENLGLETERGEMRDGLAEFQARMVQFQIREKQLEGNLRILQAQNKQSLQKLSQKSCQLLAQKQTTSQLQSNLLSLQSQLSLLQSQVHTYTSTIQTLTQDLQTQCSETAAYKQALQEKIERIAGLELEVQGERNRNRNYMSTIQQLQKLNQQVRYTVKTSNKKIQSLEQLLEGYKKERIKNRDQNEEKWREMTQFYEGEIEKLNARILGAQKSGRKVGQDSNLRVLHGEDGDGERYEGAYI